MTDSAGRKHSQSIVVTIVWIVATLHAPTRAQEAGDLNPCHVSSVQPGKADPATRTDQVTQAEPERVVAEAENARGRGEFERAALLYESAERKLRDAASSARRLNVLLRLAEVRQALGHHSAAGADLDVAIELARARGDARSIALAMSAKGVHFTLRRQFDEAQHCFEEALAEAKADDPRLVAAILNDQGNLLCARGQFKEALAAYERCVALAQERGDAKVACRALVNAGHAAAADNRHLEAKDLHERAAHLLETTDDSHEKAVLLLSMGQAARRSPGDDANAETLTRAEEWFGEALSVAQRLNDRRSIAHACLYLSQLYEQQQQTSAALQMARRGRFIAQEAQLGQSLFQLEWQCGRLLRATGQLDSAIASYWRAVEGVHSIRIDLALGFGNHLNPPSFRESVGSLYYELADLLLQAADSADDEQTVQRFLNDARRSVELLKSAELDDYFQDECVSLLRRKLKPVEHLSDRTAIIYLIPLLDRVEILVSLKGKVIRQKVQLSEKQLVAEVRDYRERLEDRTTHRYKHNAAVLYQWLIKPIEPMLVENRVDTLVFVPDGALRSVPMGALYDGERFLIERFAVAVTPGLTLMEPAPISRQEIVILLNGLSKSAHGFPPLPFVPQELGRISGLYRNKVLVDESFVTGRLKRELGQSEYSVVHIASHGQFSGDANRTFLLTYDGRLSLQDLEKVIGPSQFRSRPIELLTLSACQTAAGDDRSALGLAGVAIKAGARSALATLWCAHDEGSALIMAQFYERLRGDASISKAQALREAQLWLMQEPRYRHPCYWSPYLIIGSWL